MRSASTVTVRLQVSGQSKVQTLGRSMEGHRAWVRRKRRRGQARRRRSTSRAAATSAIAAASLRREDPETRAQGVARGRFGRAAAHDERQNALLLERRFKMPIRERGTGSVGDVDDRKVESAEAIDQPGDGLRRRFAADDQQGGAQRQSHGNPHSSRPLARHAAKGRIRIRAHLSTHALEAGNRSGSPQLQRCQLGTLSPV